MRNWKVVAIAVLTLLLVVLFLQNTEPVETRLLVATVTMPRAALLAVTGALGFLLGLLVALRFQRPNKS